MSVLARRTAERVPVGLRPDRGHLLPMKVQRWFEEPTAEEYRVLSRALAPVLNVGCGPARHTLALLARGVAALGVDVSPGAVRIASRRGAPVLLRSVFDGLPAEGSWGSALLLDGNVGIGGSPVALLERLRSVLRGGGRVLVEVGSPGKRGPSRFGQGSRGPGQARGFPWAIVGCDGLGAVATSAGSRLTELWAAGGDGSGAWTRERP
jgi:SAM-dependent methyltransferase